MKRRYRIKNKFRFLLSISLVIIIITTMLFSLVVSANNNRQKELFTYTVRNGDTLWSIATQNAHKTDVREYIYKIRKVNTLKSATIYTGQELILP